MIVALALFAAPASLLAKQVAHWTFEREDALIVDDTHAMWPATKHGFSGDGSETVPGVIGNALAFDGFDDYLSHALELPRERGSISMWVQPVDQQPRVLVYESDHPNGTASYDGFGSLYPVLENHVGQATGWSFYYQDGSGPAANSGQRWVVSGGTVTPGVWTQYTATWDRDGDLVLYLDCVEVDREPIDHVTFEDLPHTTSLIGRPSEGGRFFKGLLDEVRIFDHPLDAEEIRTAFCSFESEVSEIGPILPRGVPQQGFGSDVALSDERLAVLEPGQEGTTPGKVHVYRREGSSWLTDDVIGLTSDVETAPPALLALDGDFLASSSPGTAASGRVWVHQRGAEFWNEVAELSMPGGAVQGLLFGASISLFDDLLFVGAPSAGSAAVSGQVFVYQRQLPSETWVLIHSLTGQGDSDDFRFGVALAFGWDQLVVSEWRESKPEHDLHFFRLEDLATNQPAVTLPLTLDRPSIAWDGQGPRPCTGQPSEECLRLVLGGPGDVVPMQDGQAILFDLVLPVGSGGTVFDRVEVLEPPDLDPLDHFGRRVSVFGNHIVVGTDPGAGDRGTAYVYQLQPGGARLVQQLRPSTWDPHPERFASSVAIDGTWITAAAPRRNRSSPNSGAVFLYRTPVFGDGFESGDASAWSNQVP